MFEASLTQTSVEKNLFIEVPPLLVTAAFSAGNREAHVGLINTLLYLCCQDRPHLGADGTVGFVSYLLPSVSSHQLIRQHINCCPHAFAWSQP